MPITKPRVKQVCLDITPLHGDKKAGKMLPILGWLTAMTQHFCLTIYCLNLLSL